MLYQKPIFALYEIAEYVRNSRKLLLYETSFFEVPRNHYTGDHMSSAFL